MIDDLRTVFKERVTSGMLLPWPQPDTSTYPADTMYYGLTCDDIVYSTRTDDGLQVRTIEQDISRW